MNMLAQPWAAHMAKYVCRAMGELRCRSARLMSATAEAAHAVRLLGAQLAPALSMPAGGAAMLLSSRVMGPRERGACPGCTAAG